MHPAQKQYCNFNRDHREQAASSVQFWLRGEILSLYSQLTTQKSNICTDTCQTMVLNAHPKNIHFCELVSIKDDNMALNYNLDQHPLSQIFFIYLAEAHLTLYGPYGYVLADDT